MSSLQQRVVISHPEWGIYLGTCLGLGFWSKMDPAGQSHACTFESIQEAREIMAGWDNGEPKGVEFAPVVPDDGTYASASACVAAGLDGWSHEIAPATTPWPL